MLLIKRPFCLDGLAVKPMCDEPQPVVEVASLALQQTCSIWKRLGQWSNGTPLTDLTEITTSADYIHSAELVNIRYPRRPV